MHTLTAFLIVNNSGCDESVGTYGQAEET